MFFTDGMKSSMKRFLNITDDGVYPFKVRDLDAFGATTSYDCCMLISELFKNAKAPQAIRNKCTTWCKMNISPCFYRILGKIPGWNDCSEKLGRDNKGMTYHLS